MASPPNKDCLMALVASMAVIIIIAVHLPNATSYEYCSKQEELCFLTDEAKASGHLVCNISQVPINGTFITLYPMTRKIKKYLIHTHNRMRNQLASGWERDGSKGKFPAALRMRELIWDDELEYLAKVHTQRCNMQHDDCRNTVRFPYTGQNLGYIGKDTPRTVFMAIDYSILRWYGEKDLVPKGIDIAKKLTSTYGIGHFTLLVNEQTSRVGCAISYCTNCGFPKCKHCYFVACNYDMTNLPGAPLYFDSEESAVDCAYYNTTKSHVYLHLCANSGGIFKVKVNEHSIW